MSTHPLDRLLQKRGWRRLTFGDLGAERLTVRVICPEATLSRQPVTMTAADIKMWQQKDAVRGAIALDTPLFLRQVIEAGRDGISPITLGLTPCRCSNTVSGTDRWNSNILPLLFHQGMNHTRWFKQVIKEFTRLQQQPGWQCIDTVRSWH